MAESRESAADPWHGLGTRIAGEWRRTCIFNCDAPCVEECVPARHLGRGATALHASRHDQRFSYCLYVPTDYGDDEMAIYPLAVIVHGTERGAQAYRDAFADFAEANGCVVLAPLFPCNIVEGGFELHNYKFIAFHGIRFDQVLPALLAEVGGMYRVDTNRFLLFGISGGGQFAHRFFYLCPERLLGVSIGAPGWVALLDDKRDWWVGVRDVEEQFGAALDWPAIRSVAVQMVIGSDDTETWDVIIPEGSRYWMAGANDAGRTRRDRLDALAASFERHGIPTRQDVVPGVGHDGLLVLDPVKTFFGAVLAAARVGESVNAEAR